MHSLEEKNHLSNELERTKKKLEESNTAKARIEQELRQCSRYTRINFLFIFIKGGINERTTKSSARSRKY